MPHSSIPHDPFISLEAVSLRLRDTIFLADTSWRIHGDEHWAVIGPNGSGKSTMARALCGDVPVVRGKIIHHYRREPDGAPGARGGEVGYVSADSHRDLMEREGMKQRMRYFAGRPGEITTVRDLIEERLPPSGSRTPAWNRQAARVVDKTGIGALMERGVGSLSTGEIRKVCITLALLRSPKLLILDEPFDGLDSCSRSRLSELLCELMNDSLRVILITHRRDEILPPITHVLCLDRGTVARSGPISDVLPDAPPRDGRVGVRPGPMRVPPVQGCVPCPAPDRPGAGLPAPCGPPVLVEMRDVTVKYGDTKVLDGFSWIMRRGENCALLGGNGAGKTTVINLITGDNTHAYGQHVELFGRMKGSGESVWDIKKHIGLVTSTLQTRVPRRTAAFDVVCSGFFDSMGLYRSCSREQLRTALHWSRAFEIDGFSDTPFARLSYGQRQLVLVARAMVKSPLLLILDEPCDGLDDHHRGLLLHTVERIGHSTHTHLIYVTHREEELFSSISTCIRLDKGRVAERRRLGRGKRW